MSAAKNAATRADRVCSYAVHEMRLAFKAKPRGCIHFPGICDFGYMMMGCCERFCVVGGFASAAVMMVLPLVQAQCWGLQN